MDKKENYLDILRSIEKMPNLTQRKMALKLGFSLGKLSYCLKSLQQKELVIECRFHDMSQSFKIGKGIYFYNKTGKNKLF